MITKESARKVITGAVIVAVGAALTYASDAITRAATGGGLGEYGPAVVAVWSVVTNFVRKLITDNTTPEPKAKDGNLPPLPPPAGYDRS